MISRCVVQGTRAIGQTGAMNMIKIHIILVIPAPNELISKRELECGPLTISRLTMLSAARRNVGNRRRTKSFHFWAIVSARYAKCTYCPNRG